MSEWCRFDGQAGQRGDFYELTGAGGGTVRVAATNVRAVGQGYEVKLKAKAEVVQRPQGHKPDANVVSANAAADCPNRQTYCVGLLEFCCDNDELIGPCIGVWDCS